jgi:hypothetical protein
VNAEALAASIRERVADDFILVPFGESRFALDTPLTYPDGGSVVVYFTWQSSELLEITDYGEGYSIATARRGARRTSIKTAAAEICGSLALEFSDGRISAVVGPEEAGDALWRVATASARLADAITFSRAERPREEEVFADEVELAIRQRQIRVEREARLVGESGHEYRPSLFLPESSLIIEPIQAEAAWLRAASVYVEFGDLSQANGYRLTAVVDDRERTPEEEILRLLSQVGDVTRWSRREVWLGRLVGSDG